MPLPETPRVLYRQNPLIEVICQFRYPSVLLIDAEPPAQFQNRIRSLYPLFEVKNERGIQLPIDVSKVMGGESVFAMKRSYSFSSEDSNWTVNLTSSFLALTCRKYERWEKFKEHLDGPYQALLGVYQPAFFTRLGLRYRDLIQRSTLGLSGSSWQQLLNPHVAGEFGAAEVADDVRGRVCQLRMALEGDLGDVNVQHGVVEDESTGEPCYVIDADYFSEQRIGVEGAYEKMEGLHHHAGRLFRWCISETLHNAMEPRPI